MAGIDILGGHTRRLPAQEPPLPYRPNAEPSRPERLYGDLLPGVLSAAYHAEQRQKELYLGLKIGD